ncbi:MAG TPA: class I SAM-dependent methyltransferase [Longimicrobium sp.]|jgi:SAM-dependent methyltransferase|uniref:class I SAM-dependent methyltransferase n=1 Tax=Longimicrobium sp. TaxID=2029185 RepID=UPI002ED975EE
MRMMAGAALLLAAACARAEQAPRGENAITALGPRGMPADSFPRASRPVADIVTDTWSTEDERDSAGEAEKVMDLLGIRAGMTVADVGAGSGYYTVRLSPRVGPGGRVIAQDIMPKYLEGLRGRVEKDSLRNVQLALGEPHDPRLAPSSVDLVLLVHMYHEVEQPYAFLANLRPALRPGGRVAVVDLDRATQRHGTPLGLLECEFAATGYTRMETHDLGGGSGYLAVFRPTDGPAPRQASMRSCPAPSAGSAR